MSAAGTPSTDPWVILARERTRYEEQFRSLKPNNGIITGDQAKSFLLQSQLPPIILGQIWALADTDADGKMNIDEFSIACKLINLKLRGYEVPKGLPPSLLASLKVNTPPAIPPLPNTALVNPPSRPEPPKIAPMMSTQPLSQPLTSTQPPLLPGLIGQPPSNITPNTASMGMVQTGIVPPTKGNFTNIPNAPNIPTGIIPPMQSTVPLVQPLIDAAPSMASTAPLVSGIPLSSSTIQPVMSSAPLVSGVPLTASSIAPTIPPISSVLPPNLSGGPGIPPPIPNIPSVPVNTVAPLPAPGMSPITSQPVGVVGRPGATSTPRASITSLERTHSIDSTSSQPEWSVPHQTKLKYTQIFNTTDRTRTGFLSGAQARNVMVQTKLPQNILALIWALSDMDADGRLGCEEFVLAMHLCEQASLGHAPPSRLPPDLIPPSFRRTRTTSISSQGSAPIDQDPASTLLQNSFEDKRKENFEKGQAELERRRKTLLDQQRQEREERERKEREEQEKKEKARQEAERKRLDELEKQMRDQQEKERLIEEEKKRQADQREAARKEMERQRQLEWEKQRLQELHNQRQREQETVLKLKARNQSLTIELTTLNDQVKELSQKICDTRMGVSSVKTTIDGMRSTRDSQMQEMSQLKNKLKEQNAKLLALSQEKIKLDAKNKANTQDTEQARLAFENKEVTIKNLKTKVDDMQVEIDSKMADIENNNTQLKDLQTELKNLVNECEQLYSVYEVKRNTILDMKNSGKPNEMNAWQSTDAWGSNDNETSSDWPVDNWAASTDVSTLPGLVKYRALYEFVARNNDEISFQPGDIINVPKEQTGEPGWLAGEIRGHTGWFPEAYVEPVDGVGVRDDSAFSQTTTSIEETEATRLEGIAEVPEGSETTNSFEPTPVHVPSEVEQPVALVEPEVEPEYYIANYPYQSVEPGDLTFNAGEVIGVIKKEGDWWTGKLGNLVGIFPSNYVQKVDVNSSANTINAAPVAAPPEPTQEPALPPMPPMELSTGVSAEAVESALANVSAQSQADNEVSQISLNKAKEEAYAQAGQVVKTKKPEIASVIAPYQSTSPEQLSLARGQLIMIRKKTDSGWWEGELQAKGRKRQVGWFPASYVKVLNSSGRISGRTTPVSTTRMQQEVIIDKVIALYPYSAGNPDELTFAKDDIISVTAREEEAWWRGELNGVSGLFPSNYVSPLQQSPPLTPQNKKRKESINEFVQTEKSYVHDMSVVHEVFEEPLRKCKLISAKEIDEIFVNWQDIIFCNKLFLKDLLNANKTGSDMIGHIICKHLPEMKAYVTFCGKQLDSAALLQKLTENSTAFRDLVKKCQNNVATKGMPLSSFLIKPMQRITRYPLLINKILENTPDDHPDYKNLQEALILAESFLNSINENVRLKENQDRLNWLQQCVQNDLNIVFNSETNKLGPRQLLHYGIFNKLKSNKELLGFLFNDFFMFVQATKSIGVQFTFQINENVSYKLYKQPILIQNLMVSRDSSDNIESGTDSNRVLNIQDDKNTYKIALLVHTVSECGLWMKRIESAKEMCSKMFTLSLQNKRKTQLHLGPSCGRLLVLVQKGKRFISIGKHHTENIYCKVALGTQEQETDVARETYNNGNSVQNGLPHTPSLVWNYSMQFQLRNLNQESLIVTVYKQNHFSPDDFLGRAELRIKEILRDSQNHNGPITKKLILHQVESGEITVKLDLHLFDNY
ncbi:intersectin-1-like isoform X2 [Diabrotica virgifera virgifera]|uniref:Intersectin-1 n=1 Tax=Diabrotica virgifera virgifera TaxID=50390 RepID=A0ABM5JQN6_DIAVI|nr:intersectin-1-like isoform X2 [Diabrotica virgifera virgifera]